MYKDVSSYLIFKRDFLSQIDESGMSFGDGSVGKKLGGFFIPSSS
jgi:hypothetical protein